MRKMKDTREMKINSFNMKYEKIVSIDFYTHNLFDYIYAVDFVKTRPASNS